MASVTVATAGTSKGKGGSWSRRRRLRLQNSLMTYLILVPGGLLFLYPLLWMLSTSLKPKHQIFTYPIEWIPDTWMWSNYGEVFNQVPFLDIYDQYRRHHRDRRRGYIGRQFPGRLWFRPLSAFPARTPSSS